jgi:hypothetical protein
MLWRNVIFAIIFGFILTFPLHGKALNEDSCYKLARGLRLLGAEDIYYRGYYFISAMEHERLDRQLESMPALLQEASVEWHLGSGLNETYGVLKVSGRDYQECRAFADELIGAAGIDSSLLGQTWHLEGYVHSQEIDPAALGMRLVQILDGDLYSIQRYHRNVCLLAYVPWPGDVLMLEDGPVNLNVELQFEPINGSIRLHAGTPVLLTLSHFEE